MKGKYKRIILWILIFISFLMALNFYLDSKKKSIQVDKVFNNALIIKDNTLSGKANIDIDATLTDTHFIYTHLMFSKTLNGTLTLNGKKYNISASTSVEDDTLKGILTKDNNSLVSDFEITLSKNLDEICIYKENYIIAYPANNLDEAIDIFKDLVDIPIK